MGHPERAISTRRQVPSIVVCTRRCHPTNSKCARGCGHRDIERTSLKGAYGYTLKGLGQRQVEPMSPSRHAWKMLWNCG